MDSPWMRPAVAAKYVGLTVSSLKTMRARDRGPRYRNPTGGRMVIYHRDDLDAWLNRQTVDTSDSGVANE